MFSCLPDVIMLIQLKAKFLVSYVLVFSVCIFICSDFIW